MTELDTSAAEETTPPKPKLNLVLKLEERSACQRHVTVTIPREDIDRYFSEAVDDLKGKAEVPGFRPGRAPRKLVESRFRTQVADQVKGALLMDSLHQINEDEKLSAISEPDLDLDAVTIPDEGPLTFEFDLEVRPNFDLPEWKGLSLNRPTHEYSADEVDYHLRRLLRRYSELVPVEGPAQREDQLTMNLTFRKDGQELSRLEELEVRVCSTLSFHDASLEKFDELVAGAAAGDVRQFQVTLSADAENEELRGTPVDAELEVLDVKRFEYPQLDREFLMELGGFRDEDDLRDAVREELERQLKYHQQREIRQQITGILTAGADWDLPPELLRKQYRRELDRFVLELRSAGFGDDVIQAHENQIRQNSLASTRRALKEHFILERIAEDQGIEALPEDFDDEIELIAAQSDQSARRVRARLEKRDQMDALRNQIVERKVIDMITQHAEVAESPFDPPRHETEAVDHSICGQAERIIPDAKHGGGAEELPSRVDHS
ncbi:MAG: trigger factor [Pirellulaceae bacterium]|nr:trigger factor [Pirellulaceae bacterium]